MKRTLSAAMSLLLVASASAQAPGVTTLAKIGTAAAVRGAVNAVSAGTAVGHVISSGKPLFLNDHVTTDAVGRLQVLLLDETIFTLGPNSDMVLDEFVYDPKTSAGKLSASIAKGTFRFVTGKIASKDPEKMKLKVAVGTIGVRGSIGVGETGPDGTTIINGGARNPDNHDDAAGIYAQSGGKTVNLIQPGVGTHIGPDGRLDKARFMTEELNRIMGTLQTQVTDRGAGSRGDVGARSSATNNSGRSTAIGGVLADASLETLGLSDSADAVVTQAVQQSMDDIADGVTGWQQILSNLTTGTGVYSNSGGAYSCTSGCVGSGTWGFNATVDFAARQINSGASFFINSGGPLGFDSGTLNAPIAFGTTGPAVFTIGSGEISGASGSFVNTQGTFYNSGGTVAKNLTVNLQYTSNSAQTVTGTATGTR